MWIFRRQYRSMLLCDAVCTRGSVGEGPPVHVRFEPLEERCPLAVYVSGDIPTSIPPQTTITSSLFIPDLITIADLNAQIDVSHTPSEDLDVFLVGPNGRRVELFTGVGGAGNGFVGTVLDDEAATSVVQASAPFTGSFRPEGSLSDFDDTLAQGTWSVEISNALTMRADVNHATATATLNSWSLSITDGPTTGTILQADESGPFIVLPGIGGTYRQAFDDFGTGEAGAPLPNGWTATTLGETLRDVNRVFPAQSVDGVFSAGPEASHERALAVGGNTGHSLLVAGKIIDSDLHALRVQFDLEAWGTFASTASGEASFDVLLEADTGEGLTHVANLGRVTTDTSRAASGTFSSIVALEDTASATLITSADFNRDGNIDFAIAEDEMDGASGRLNVYLGDGRGEFQASYQSTSLTVPNDLETADFNGDGITDIAVADWDFFRLDGLEGENDGVHVFFGIGDGTFRVGEVLVEGFGPTGLAVGDVDDDSYPDVVVVNALSNAVTIFYGSSNESFPTQLPLETGQLPFDVILNDFNGDEVLDLATADLLEGTVTVYLSGNGEPFQAVTILQFDEESLVFFVRSGDLDGDDRPDLAVTFSTNETDFMQILINNGEGDFLPQEPILLGPISDIAVLEDFDQDGHLDIAVPAVEARHTSILFNRGDGTFESPEIVSSRGDVFAITSADANNDGYPDVLIATDEGVELAYNRATLLDGNDPANRSSFDSGIMPIRLPEDAAIQLRFDVPTDAADHGYVYGIDNVVLSTFLQGDANGDGEVGFNDFLLVSTNFGRMETPTFEEGDFNNDGKVDFSDFLILSTNFGRRVQAQPAAVDALFQSFA